MCFFLTFCHADTVLHKKLSSSGKVKETVRLSSLLFSVFLIVLHVFVQTFLCLSLSAPLALSDSLRSHYSEQTEVNFFEPCLSATDAPGTQQESLLAGWMTQRAAVWERRKCNRRNSLMRSEHWFLFQELYSNINKTAHCLLQTILLICSCHTLFRLILLYFFFYLLSAYTIILTVGRNHKTTVVLSVLTWADPDKEEQKKQGLCSFLYWSATCRLNKFVVL